MQVQGIGDLIDRGTHWVLVYDHCDHNQEFARIGLEQVRDAVREVRRNYAECLTCLLTRQSTRS